MHYRRSSDVSAGTPRSTANIVRQVSQAPTNQDRPSFPRCPVCHCHPSPLPTHDCTVAGAALVSYGNEKSGEDEGLGFSAQYLGAFSRARVCDGLSSDYCNAIVCVCIGGLPQWPAGELGRCSRAVKFVDVRKNHVRVLCMSSQAGRGGQFTSVVRGLTLWVGSSVAHVEQLMGLRLADAPNLPMHCRFAIIVQDAREQGLPAEMIRNTDRGSSALHPRFPWWW